MNCEQISDISIPNLLIQLPDVNVTDLTDNDILAYNALTKKFVNRQQATGFTLVNTYADLPDPTTTIPDKIYAVKTSTGVWLVNRKTKGFYQSTGTDWNYLGDFPVSTSQLNNDSGYVTLNTVKADSDIADAITKKHDNSDSILAVLTGFVASGSRLALDATDTILNAFNKIQKWLSDLGSLAFKDSIDYTTSDLTNKPVIPSVPSDIGAEPAFTHNTGFNLNLGTTAGTVCEGNDSRLADARTPTAHAATHKTGQSDALAASDIGAEPAFTHNTGFNLNLGTTAGTVSEGNHTHLFTGLTRILTIVSNAQPTINIDNYDCVTITALATDITSMSANLSGTINNFQRLLIRIKDDGSPRAITWGATFEAKGQALPTTTVAGKVLHILLIGDSVTGKLGCVAAPQEA